MINNRVAQLIFRTAFLTFSFLGILESFGLYAGQNPGIECLVYYTTLSNLLCFFVMLAVTVSTAKYIMKGELYGYNTVCVKLKFYSTLVILVTFVVYNFILADFIFEPGWNNLGNITKHIGCPLMFVIDCLLFDRHRSLKWYDCLLCTVLPLLYCVFIFIRAALLPADYSGTVYPYFFLDAGELGVGGVAVWLAVLLAAFIVIAFLFWLYDRLEYRGGRLTFSFRD
ncbi:MAG: Pr6Pr family membrane protein [Clostridia bacterium]|nr:Pr6Pr family membrane protein [Clostridia bacterium]MBQ8371087.1 Pr6Pr family membrane protein [Clostridia bacterium]